MNDKFYKELEFLLKTTRLRKGLTQLKLAKLAGLSCSTVCRAEFDVKKTKLSTLIKILEALEVKNLISKLINWLNESLTEQFPKVRY